MSRANQRNRAVGESQNRDLLKTNPNEAVIIIITVIIIIDIIRKDN